MTIPEDVKDRPILRKKIWEPINERNEHYVGGIVGREGSAKSYTALGIAETVDPTFSAEQVFFEPKDFMEHLRDTPKDELQGKVFVGDEAGVGMGNRTWYEKDQVLLNQALQTVRDDNIALIVTLPRLEELDVQTEGRLKGFFEMVGKDTERMIATARYKMVDPSRGGQDKIYKKYVRVHRGGAKVKLREVQFRPPSDSLVEEYEPKKQKFKEELYGEVIEESGDDETQEDKTERLKEIANVVVDNEDKYLSKHGGNGTMYLDKDLIKMEHGLSRRDAQKVKKLAEKEVAAI
jgi:ABC-type dipeptide/oligopeptide/nickel transport system ATPase component